MTRRDCLGRGLTVIAATASVLVLLTVAGIRENVDLRVAAAFFRPADGWFLANREPWHFLYRFGTIPGIVLSAGALVVWGLSFVKPRLAPFRATALMIVLTSVIGAGLLVNAVLKPHWGRPRPDQIVAFGGLWEYRHVSSPGTPGQGESFPCGHCTMGFVFTALFFARRRAPRLAMAGGGAGILLGGLLSATRIVQGAHFFLDTLWSLGVILLTAQILYYLVLQIPARDGAPAGPVCLTPRRRRWLMAGVVVAVLVMGAAFATRRPFFRTFTDRFDPSPVGAVRVRLNTAPSRFTLTYGKGREGRVRIDSQGFGWIGVDFSITPAHRRSAGELTLDYDIHVGSYFSELYHSVAVTLPVAFKDVVPVTLTAPETAAP